MRLKAVMFLWSIFIQLTGSISTGVFVGVELVQQYPILKVAASLHAIIYGDYEL